MFQLREGASPYHGQAFPVPKIHKDTIIKEVEKLCKLGVLERQPASELALPSFIVPTKDRTTHFLSDFWEVNKRLVRKPFPIPKICTVPSAVTQPKSHNGKGAHETAKKGCKK